MCTFALYFPPPPWLDSYTLLQPLNICTRMFFLPLITVLIVLIPTIPLKYNITNTSFTSSHLLPPLILTPALYIYLSYLHFLPQLLLFLSQLLFILHIHFLLFILHIYFLLYISIYSLITLYICTYSALSAILHFWLDAKLYFVASVLVLCAMTIQLNLKTNLKKSNLRCHNFRTFIAYLHIYTHRERERERHFFYVVPMQRQN